jgi:L-fuconolactonase
MYGVATAADFPLTRCLDRTGYAPLHGSISPGGWLMTRIDAHHHLWDVNHREHMWLDGPALTAIRRTFTVTDFVSEAAAAGFDHGVLVQVLPDVDETREFLAVAAQSEAVAGVVGWADLTAPDIADEVAALRAAPGGDLLVGIRHLVQGEADPRWLCRADVRRGLKAIGDAGLCYDLLTLPHQLPAAIETVRALPEVTFVLDHLSKPPIASGELEPWASSLRELAAAPNVFCKLSGMVTEADLSSWTVETLRPYAEVALDAFGPSRIMFGSDWPVCLLAATYSQVADAAVELVGQLSSGERESIFGGTAVRAYGLRV